MVSNLRELVMDRDAGSRSSAHGKGHEEGGSAYTKVGWSLRSPTGKFHGQRSLQSMGSKRVRHD